MYNVTDEVPENTRAAIHSCDGEINMNDLIAGKPMSCLWCLILCVLISLIRNKKQAIRRTLTVMVAG